MSKTNPKTKGRRATAILRSGRKISVRTTRSCVLLTASLMMRLFLQLRARASVAAVLRQSPCAQPQQFLPTGRGTTPKTYIQTGAGYTISVRIGYFRPAEIGCLRPARNGGFRPALTAMTGNHCNYYISCVLLMADRKLIYECGENWAKLYVLPSFLENFWFVALLMR